MSKREVRIGFKKGGETGRRIGSLGKVSGDDIVVRQIKRRANK
jgi:hypothetical protein